MVLARRNALLKRMQHLVYCLTKESKRLRSYVLGDDDIPMQVTLPSQKNISAVCLDYLQSALRCNFNGVDCCFVDRILPRHDWTSWFATRRHLLRRNAIEIARQTRKYISALIWNVISVLILYCSCGNVPTNGDLGYQDSGRKTPGPSLSSIRCFSFEVGPQGGCCHVIFQKRNLSNHYMGFARSGSPDSTYRLRNNNFQLFSQEHVFKTERTD